MSTSAKKNLLNIPCVPWLSILFSLCIGALAARPAQGQPLRVLVSILPQKHFVERIGGPHVRVTVLVGPGQSPETWEASPRILTEIGRAGLWLRTGVPVEMPLLPKLARMYPKLRIEDTAKGITLRTMETVIDLHETGGDRSEHTHAQGNDPHIWLSPAIVKVQADAICRALCETMPAGAEKFRKNLASLQRDLTQLESDLRGLLSGVAGRAFLVFHPAWGYLCDQFGLRQVPVEIEGKSPSPRQLAAVTSIARREKIRVIFIQAQFSAAAAEAVAQEIGGTVVSLDPLAEQYFDNMRHIGRTIAQHLR